MSKFGILVIFVSWCVFGVLGSIIAGPNDPKVHFKDFSNNLLLQSDLDEFSVEKGAAISSPFGVGYMLANINERIWNVSNYGLDQVLSTPKAADEYQALLDYLNKGKMSTSSTLYTKEQNVTVLPEGSQKMKTGMKYVDFIEDWKTTWMSMNAEIANQTGGRLDDQLIPKGGWWGGAFYYFTMGAFINTNHYKSSWTTSWNSIGSKKFHDGANVPYYETEGTFPYLEAENYTSVAIALKEGKKSVVFVFPKTNLVDFLKTELPKLSETASPKSWNSEKAKKVQLPELNITLLDQHYKKLESLGLNYTFCVDEPATLDVANHKGAYFMGPIVQSHHVRLSPEFFEVASATGSSLNSEEKMREELEFQGPPPSSEIESSATSSAEQQADGSEFVLPVQLDAKLAQSLADGEVKVEKVDVIVKDTDNNDTITAASTSSVEEVLPAASNENATYAYPSVPGPQSPEEVLASASTTSTTEAPSTTPFVPEVLPENTIRFDRPFFWYLHDEEMGPLYYGTVHSIATYQKEYGIETDEDLWLYDAYKTLLWNCP